MRKLRHKMLVALHFAFAIPAYATSCVVPTVEEVVEWGREAQSNSFYKGFLIGFIFTAFCLNLGWFVHRTKRWFSGLLASLAALPLAILYLLAEAMSGGCSFSGIAARYYVYPAGVLILLLMFQMYWARRDRGILSIAEEI